MNVIDVKIRDLRVIARFHEEPFVLLPGDYCLVDHEGDKEIAKVKCDPYVWQEDLPPEDDVFVVRSSTDEDFEILRQNRVVEREGYKVALEKIEHHNLPMALATVERSFDGKKMRFYFTAEHRIDFRELVKDLAYVYKTRIEMRQIGVRDRSRKVGGYGICGQELCCSRFLQKFEPITIRMAKEQNLALNPTKISGLCGRLMCCLAYESDQYVDARALFPPAGCRVSTPHGEGVVTDMNYVQNTINVRVDESRIVACQKNEITVLAH
ncbi:MAG: stage 0 sporulation protein [Candidatus Omnitrophota bacterium]|jgi:cell fate regulator YaaT (PSP1 superfamily)|nr:MAG: stage 0 sporulation protein [Candidatus Omnitrophota bacterium]